MTDPRLICDVCKATTAYQIIYKTEYNNAGGYGDTDVYSVDLCGACCAPLLQRAIKGEDLKDDCDKIRIQAEATMLKWRSEIKRTY